MRDAAAPAKETEKQEPMKDTPIETSIRASMEVSIGTPVETPIETPAKTPIIKTPPESSVAGNAAKRESPLEAIKSSLENFMENSQGDFASLIDVRSVDLAALPPLVLPPPVKPRPRPPVRPGGVVPAPSDKMLWPVDGKVTSGFGRRGRRGFHAGIDIPMPRGTSIRAAQSGVVLDVGSTKDRQYRGYGNVVLLDHGNGIVTMYAHCHRVTIKKGQSVKRGDVVGTVGSTGRSTTNHLHFEVRKNGKAVNPIPYLPAR
jgi:murein DD-endopeptidase MepM/ murein hydrolase activator NlpD